MPTAGWTKVSPEEQRLAKKWYWEQQKNPREIADLLDRDKSTITRLLVKQVHRKKQGRPRALSEADIDFLERRLHDLILKSMGKYHVTAAMVKRSARCKVSVKSIQLAFRKRRIFFRKKREKPLLTEDDVKARYAWAIKYRHKTRAWWLKAFDAAIDGKLFKVYLNGKERLRDAKHATYGAYRKPSKGLHPACVRPKGSLHHNTGAKGCLIQAAVGHDRVMLWHEIDGSWSGRVATTMYTGPLKMALRRNYPNKRTHKVLEDNDPTGYKSGAGVAAKRASKIDVFEIPCRSPDLNPLDYSIWSEVNKRMRAQERTWKTKKESRDQYVARLKRTAQGLDRAFVDDAIGNLAVRSERLYQAKGGYFLEGGSSG